MSAFELAEELKQQLEEDIAALLTLLARPEPFPPSHVRILTSSILRKWLVESWLDRLGGLKKIAFTLPTLDTELVSRQIENDPQIRFFVAGGIALEGVYTQGLYVSDAQWTGELPIAIDQMHYINVKPNVFLRQKRIFHEGSWFRTEEVIKHMSNKIGGIHFDPARGRPIETALDRAAKYFELGNPGSAHVGKLVENEQADLGKFKIKIPDGTNYKWTCLHVEMLAAAQALINVRANGLPLAVFDSRTEHLRREEGLAVVTLGQVKHIKPSLWHSLVDRLKVWWFVKIRKQWKAPDRN